MCREREKDRERGSEHKKKIFPRNFSIFILFTGLKRNNEKSETIDDIAK